MYFPKLTLTLFLVILLNVISKGQTVTKTFTIVPFADMNNNCVYDSGEDTLVDFRVEVTDPTNWYGTAGMTNANGRLAMSLPVPAASPSYSIMELQGLIEPCAVVASGNVAYYTVYYLPIKPVILNAAVGYGSVLWGQINGKVWKYAPMDTLKYCSGSLNASNVSQIEMHNNLTSTAPFYTGTMTVKLDANTIDTYSFGFANTSTPFTSANSTGTIMSNQNGQMLLFQYKWPNTLVSAGMHTLSLNFTPFTGYPQGSVMSIIVGADSCGNMSGQTYMDCNNNCAQDSWETYGGNNISAVVLTNASNTVTCYPSANGNYNVSAPIGIYTVNAIGTNSSYSVCPVTSFTTNVSYLSSYTLNYGVQELNPNSVDYRTFLTMSGANPGPGAVPGGTLAINAYNSKTGGPLCTINPTLVPTALKVVLPVQMSFSYAIGSTPFPSNIIPCSTGDTIVWNNPGPNAVHQIAVYTATNAVIGNQYCITSIVNPQADNDPSNNIYTRCTTFGGPFDPNEKTSETPNMFPNGNILPNTQDLTYTIEFQNLGNGPAVNVSINDTISQYLDLATLEIISSSYPVQTQINSASRIIDFTFKGIYLQPASVNDAASHGYVRYKIKLNPGLPLGTSIKNRAHIYFDYNSAVSTNQTVNTIALTTGIDQPTLNSSVIMYPNPTKDNTVINSSVLISRVEVLNCVGQVMLEKEVNSFNTNVDLSAFNQGVYLIQIHSQNGIVIKKIIKQ
jgi:hypothetical protein